MEEAIGDNKTCERGVDVPKSEIVYRGVAGGWGRVGPGVPGNLGTLYACGVALCGDCGVGNNGGLVGKVAVWGDSDFQNKQ